MAKILVIHGPNLNLLGSREVNIYGKVTIDDINKELSDKCRSENIAIEIFQSNHEGEIVDKIHQARANSVNAILINPAAYTHTSVAIRDAISASGIPAVEVHLSNIYAREEFRHTSLIAPVAAGQISGFGKTSYALGLHAAIELIKISK